MTYLQNLIMSVTWTVNPEAFSFFGREIRWYGILWAVGLLCAVSILQNIHKKENLNPKWFDSLFIYMVVAIILGARLGHCLFYQPDYYLAHPIDILKIWEGGLASHGAVVGIIIAVWLYSRNVTKKSMLWALDRLMVVTGVTAAMIRLGNLMNHEIYGAPTDLSWGFRFISNISEWQRGAEAVYTPASHPTQIYEAVIYLFIFAVTMHLYYRTTAIKKEGLITGVGLIMIFIARFFIEFIKNVQVKSEEAMRADTGLILGQWLSIPFIIWGIWLVWHAVKKK